MESVRPGNRGRTVNRWTLEPLAFLLPFISVALAIFVTAGIAVASGFPAGPALVLVLVVIIVAPTVASVLRKR